MLFCCFRPVLIRWLLFDAMAAGWLEIIKDVWLSSFLPFITTFRILLKWNHNFRLLILTTLIYESFKKKKKTTCNLHYRWLQLCSLKLPSCNFCLGIHMEKFISQWARSQSPCAAWEKMEEGEKMWYTENLYQSLPVCIFEVPVWCIGLHKCHFRSWVWCTETFTYPDINPLRC